MICRIGFAALIALSVGACAKKSSSTDTTDSDGTDAPTVVSSTSKTSGNGSGNGGAGSKPTGSTDSPGGDDSGSEAALTVGPSGSSDQVTIGSTYTVHLSVANADSAAQIALYYKNSKAGCADDLTGWTQLITGLPKTTTTWSWDTTGVASDIYYICGVLDDGANPPTYAVSAGALAVLSPMPALAGLWHFTEASGTSVADSSGNGNNGSFSAGVTLNTDGCQCATFDGTGAITVASPTNLPINDDPYALTAWIKPIGNRRGIIGWGGYSGGDTNAFRTADTPGLTNYWFGPDLESTTGTSSITDGNWHFVIAQFDGTTRSLWLDGVNVGQDTPGNGNAVQAVNFAIGLTYPGVEYFDGDMDEVAIYKAALTSVQITALYHHGR